MRVGDRTGLLPGEGSVEEVLAGSAAWCVLCCSAEELTARLARERGCLSLVATDGPYFGVVDEGWDNRWAKEADFLAWFGGLLDGWREALAPNGSLYAFASPASAWGVEGEVRKRFELINAITWAKPHGTRAEKACKEALRSYFPVSERVLFAEQRGSDAIALGESAYGRKCDELRGFVFEPLRKYLDGERERAGLTRDEIDRTWREQRGNRGGMSSHWFSRSQWALPTRANYEWLRALFAARVDEPLREKYEPLREKYEELREKYEELREKYEELRRPFSVTPGDFYTDVWAYAPIPAGKSGRHLCEKPWRMAADIVRVSTRPGDVGADFFAGSGWMPAALVSQGRRAIACDSDPLWAERSRRACALAHERKEPLLDVRRLF